MSAETIVERVAKVLCRRDCHPDLQCPNPCDSWKVFLPDARAAIEEIKRPTEAMVDAGLAATVAYLSIPGSAATVNREKMRRRFVAMLDYALTESTEEGKG